MGWIMGRGGRIGWGSVACKRDELEKFTVAVVVVSMSVLTSLMIDL